MKFEGSDAISPQTAPYNSFPIDTPTANRYCYSYFLFKHKGFVPECQNDQSGLVEQNFMFGFK